MASVKALLHKIEHSIAIHEGFSNPVQGSRVTLDEVLRRAPDNWCIKAEEPRDLGLSRAVI